MFNVFKIDKDEEFVLSILKNGMRYSRSDFLMYRKYKVGEHPVERDVIEVVDGLLRKGFIREVDSEYYVPTSWGIYLMNRIRRDEEVTF